jgi:hypothetical protein
MAAKRKRPKKPATKRRAPARPKTVGPQMLADRILEALMPALRAELRVLRQTELPLALTRPTVPFGVGTLELVDGGPHRIERVYDGPRLFRTRKLLISSSGPGAVLDSMTVDGEEQLTSPGTPVELWGTKPAALNDPDEEFAPFRPGAVLAFEFRATRESVVLQIAFAGFLETDSEAVQRLQLELKQARMELNAVAFEAAAKVLTERELSDVKRSVAPIEDRPAPAS